MRVNMCKFRRIFTVCYVLLYPPPDSHGWKALTNAQNLQLLERLAQSEERRVDVSWSVRRNRDSPYWMPAIKTVEIWQCREIWLQNKENRRGKAIRSLYLTVLWIGIVVMPIRIRISILMPIRIRISILMPIRIRIFILILIRISFGLKTRLINMRILSHVLHMLENRIVFKNFLWLQYQITMFKFLYHQHGIGVKIVGILDSVLNFCGKKKGKMMRNRHLLIGLILLI